MSHNSDEVRAILTVLLRKVDHLASDYTAQHIAMQLYGLQNMNTSIPQVGGMLGIIGEKLTPIPSQSISAESFCNSVYGLKVSN